MGNIGGGGENGICLGENCFSKCTLNDKDESASTCLGNLCSKVTVNKT